MSNFDRRQLRYFVAVAEELHFGKAAQRLHISQPPLSQQIAALEDDLGACLFERTKRKVEITAAGQQFLSDARRVLAEMQKAGTRARSAAAGQTGVLRVGLNYSAPLSHVLSGVFHHFVRQYPEIGLDLHENTSDKQIDALHNRRLDLCFMWPTRDDESPATKFLPLSDDELKLVLRRDSPLARKPCLTAADLRGKTIFLSPRQMRRDFYDTLISACRAADFTPDIRSEINQMPFIVTMVAAGQGIAFVPSFLERIRPAGTLFRRCNFIPCAVSRMPLCLAYRAKESSPLVRNFVAVARDFSAGKH